MLKYELNGDVLHVTETIMSFIGDKVSHWYYNINTWQKSSHGKLNDVVDLDMNEQDIYWVKKYYLPKVA